MRRQRRLRAPDGDTILMALVGPLAIDVRPDAGKMAFDPQKNFMPPTLVARVPPWIVTHP